MTRVFTTFTAIVGAACLGLIGCGLPSENVKASPFQATRVDTPMALLATPGFADEAGGGIFLGPDKKPVRLRLDGTPGSLALHTMADVDTGPVASIHPFGPHGALLSAQNGVFVAESGWIIPPPWRDQIKGAAIRGAAVGGGTAWIARDQGVLRVTDGRLFELRIEAEPVTGTTALAVTTGGDAETTLWLAQGSKLRAIAAREDGTLQVTAAPLSQKDVGADITALVGLAASKKGESMVFAVADGSLFRIKGDDARRFDVGGGVDEIAGGGRFLWVRAGARLVQYDADADVWGEATGLGNAEKLLAADPSGVAWARAAGKTFAVSRGVVPRILGLHQNMRLFDAELVVRASIPADLQGAELSFVIDDGQPIKTQGPFFSLGGEEGEGNAKPYSFAALAPGLHTVSAVLKLMGGVTTRRSVAFDYHPAAGTVATFEKDIKPIHEARCARCHTRGPGPDLSTFEKWKASAAKVVASVRDRRMPADGPLDPAQIQKIERWAAGGAQP